ncbi:MAG: hypothetical protein P4M15_13250 [Alphaproteobacteria bacterium]|nr:hypothetical protein [Alphaproteobacteria bacterium]
MSSSPRKRRQTRAAPTAATVDRVSYVAFDRAPGPGRKRAALAVLAGFAAILAVIVLGSLHHPGPQPPSVDKTVDAYDLSVTAPQKAAAKAGHKKPIYVKPRPEPAVTALPEEAAAPAADLPDDEPASVRSDKDEAVFQAGVAHTLIDKGDISQALRFLHRAAELDPRNMNYRLDLAVLYDRAGDGHNAAMLYREVLDAAARHDPSVPSSLNVADIRKRAEYLSPKASE